jgi:hypothetical protein
MDHPDKLIIILFANRTLELQVTPLLAIHDVNGNEFEGTILQRLKLELFACDSSKLNLNSLGSIKSLKISKSSTTQISRLNLTDKCLLHLEELHLPSDLLLIATQAIKVSSSLKFLAISD